MNARLPLPTTISIAELARVLAAQLLAGAAQSFAWRGVSTDSRQFAAGQIYCALVGEHFDGHDFIPSVLTQEPALLIVARAPAVSCTVPVIVVKDTLAALQQLAAWWRGHLAIPVIAVTGSNGKTTVKEMIAALLRQFYPADQVFATPGNLNNHIGVPLSLLRLTAAHQVAVVELGMNHVGEIAQLAALARPTVALINNAQREHQEFMASVANVARENGQVLSALGPEGCAVVPTQTEFLPLWHSQNKGAGFLTFGIHQEHQTAAQKPADLTARAVQLRAQAVSAQITWQGQVVAQLALPMPGLHALHNALAAMASVWAALPTSIRDANPTTCWQKMVGALAQFTPVKGRMTRHTRPVGAHTWLVIDDSYNANPDSVRAAIQVLAHNAGHKILVLGDMAEVGDQGPAFHQEIGTYARTQGVDALLTLGQLSRASNQAFAFQGSHQQNHFATPQDLAQALSALMQAHSGCVLVKGSRSMRMERVLAALPEFLPSTQRSPVC